MTSLRVVTYNIHKGVRGMGPTQRLELDGLARAVREFDADIVCLQEVRHMHRRQQQRFGYWPTDGQAAALCPDGYHVLYRSNAYTRHGEHGNAILSRWPVLASGHHDVSDHRFEQRGLLHGVLDVSGRAVHVVVVHLGLIAASRARQVQRLLSYLEREVPPDAAVLVAGDFNDWGERLHEPLAASGLRTFAGSRQPTFPARLPLLALDRVYVRRGLTLRTSHVPRGSAWVRLSDHLPLVVELDVDP